MLLFEIPATQERTQLVLGSTVFKKIINEYWFLVVVHRFFFHFRICFCVNSKIQTNYIEGVRFTRKNLSWLQAYQERKASKALFSASVSSHMNTHKAAIAVSCAASGLLSRNPQDLQEGTAGGSKGVQAPHPPPPPHTHTAARLLQGEGSSSFQGRRSCACPAQMVTFEFNTLWFITIQKAERPCFLKTSANPPLHKEQVKI